jgi:predicted transposase YbfD/YdcC
VLSICGILAGADDWVSIATFARERKDWFKRFLKLENGIPSHDVFSSVFSKISTEKFHECFVSWVRTVSCLLPGEVVPIDGKTLRRSHDERNNLKAAHVVSAWANDNKMVLGQVKTEEKSNEITAIPKLLKMLELKGALVTIDAMGCQKQIISDIIGKEADYLIAVKENQPKLYSEIIDLFEHSDKNGYKNIKFDFSEKKGHEHGRKEERRCWVIYNPKLSMSKDWKGLKSIVMIESTRIIKGKESLEYRYYICSSERNAEYILQSTRAHWSIENSLHWVLDISFREDECRVRKGNGAANLAMLRHIALNLLKNDKTKLGIKNKRLKAGWSSSYLENLLAGI